VLDRIGIVLLAVAIAGCGKEAAAPSAPAQCDARMAALEKRLVPLAAEPVPMVLASAELEPIETKAGRAIEGLGPVLEVRRDGTLAMLGQPLESVEELEARMQVERELGRSTSPLYLMIDRRTSRAAVEQLVASLPDGTEARAIVVGPERAKTAHDRELETKPSVRELMTSMHEGDPAQRATTLAAAMSKAIVPCAPLVKVFGDVAAVDAQRKGERIATGAPRAIRECNCQMHDLDQVEYALLGIFNAFGRPHRWLPLADALALLPA